MNQLIKNTFLGLLFMIILSTLVYVIIKAVVAVIGVKATWGLLILLVALPFLNAVGSALGDE